MALPRVTDGRDGLQTCTVAVNMLNKESRTADNGLASSFGVWRGVNNSSP